MSAKIKEQKSSPIVENKYPGISLLNFRFLFKKVREVLRILDYPNLPSPYSLIPFISQAIGLDIPTMGSGRSPYSIISYFTRLNKNIFLENEKGLTHQQRRDLIDEIYNMIAPYLLDEQANYIDLLISTKYKEALKSISDSEVSEFKDMLFKKFDILHKFMSRLQFAGGHYSHIAHYGYLEDLRREQNFIKNFDSQALKLWSDNSYPIVLEMQIDNFKATNKTICGWYILVPNYTEELLKSKALRQSKLLQASLLAKKLNAKFSGMAGLIASFSKGGVFLADNIKGHGFTTGHSFTIANIYEIVKNIAKRVSLNLAQSTIAIVGAAGSIGSGVAKLISENNIERILLVDMPNMVSAAKLDKLKVELQRINPDNLVVTSKILDDVVTSDLLIVATNATTSFIESKHLKKGAIVIDDSFPKNVSRQTVKERDDIILLEGGVAQFPKQQSAYVARNIPDLLDLSVSKLVSCKQAYGCLCESFILAAGAHTGNYGLGDADPKLAKEIWEKGRELGIGNAVFQNYGFAVEESRIKRVRNIIKVRGK